ncbi:hypothetical protein OKW46_006251 [Paraburkholderia sp. WSM4179]|nr:hypothetical protein [Paraburkholderia sp. WSM4179]
MRVINRPFSKPNKVLAPMPHRIARIGGTPSTTANFVMMIEPKAITMPQDRSMPPVSTISVWPIAMTATTIVCCRISDRFWNDRKRLLCEIKNAQASTSAISGPISDSDGRCSVKDGRGRPAGAEGVDMMAVLGT